MQTQNEEASLVLLRTNPHISVSKVLILEWSDSETFTVFILEWSDSETLAKSLPLNGLILKHSRCLYL